MDFLYFFALFVLLTKRSYGNGHCMLLRRVNKQFFNLPCLRCCVHTRDFVPGSAIPDQIVTRCRPAPLSGCSLLLPSVSSSRRTLIVLSSQYTKAEWTRMEFHVAHQRSHSELWYNESRKVTKKDKYWKQAAIVSHSILGNNILFLVNLTAEVVFSMNILTLLPKSSFVQGHKEQETEADCGAAATDRESPIMNLSRPAHFYPRSCPAEGTWPRSYSLTTTRRSGRTTHTSGVS